MRSFKNKKKSFQSCLSKRIATNLKRDLQSVSGDLQDSSLWQLPRNTHPGVGSEHGAPQLLTGNNHDMVGNHCKRSEQTSEILSDPAKRVAGLPGVGTLTDGGEYVGEAEVIHSIKGQEMVEELLFLIITAEERVSLVKFPTKNRRYTWLKDRTNKDKVMTGRQARFSHINYEGRSKLLMWWWTKVWCSATSKDSMFYGSLINWSSHETRFPKDRWEKGTRKLPEVGKEASPG